MYERLLMNGKLIKFPLRYWNILTDTVVCLTGIVHTLENELELFVTNSSKKAITSTFFMDIQL